MFSIGVYRSYAVRGVESSARVELASPEEEPYDEWVEVADTIIEQCSGRCTIVVLGPADSGKNSFSALLASRGLLGRLRVAVVDADVGQADLGPPGFIGLAYPRQWVSWLRSLEPRLLRFIGSIEPSPLIGRIISSCVELQHTAFSEGSQLVIVDSDGWVEGWSALEYKVDLVRALSADHIVVVGDDRLSYYMGRLFPGMVHRVVKPMVQAVGSTEDRRKLRQENYRRFLEGSIVEVDLEEIPVYGACIAVWDGTGRVREVIEEALERDILEAVTEYPGGICVYLRDIDHRV